MTEPIIAATARHRGLNLLYIDGSSLNYSSKHDSPKYGQHYTPKEVIDLFAPSPARVNAVRAWLEGAGVEGRRISQSVNKQWLQFDASTAEVETLLHTKYHIYKHPATGNSNVACDEYVYLTPSHPVNHLANIHKVPRPGSCSGTHRLHNSRYQTIHHQWQSLLRRRDQREA